MRVASLVILKISELTACPFGVFTVIFPSVVPLETSALILVSPSPTTLLAGISPIKTSVAPVKPLPVIVIVLPEIPSTGVKLTTVGGIF